jgi:hypothetical protein
MRKLLGRIPGLLPLALALRALLRETRRYLGYGLAALRQRQWLAAFFLISFSPVVAAYALRLARRPASATVSTFHYTLH